MKQQKLPLTLTSVLAILRYDLEYLSRFEGKPCYITFEYKYYVISLGIEKLEKLQTLQHGKEQNMVDSLLASYRKALQTVL